MSTADQPPPAAAEQAECGSDMRMWNSGWQRFVFPSLWLIYLGQTVGGVHEHSDGAAAVAGYVIVAVFAACYILALPTSRQHTGAAFWQLYGVMVVLTGVETFFAHDDAFIFLVYLSVLTVASRASWAAAAVVGYAVAGTFVPRLVPSWHQGIIWSLGIVVLLVSFAMYGFFHVMESNRALAAARAEVARLAAENERSRIARDLHDLLGHSLTTITVKAGLARRLAERGSPEQSLREITEVEQLSRRTLGDVRAAVAGHRDVTLAGELATAREVLRAAGIVAELPGSVDAVDPRLSETFGWVVREGITNVVRHSHAEQCRVTLGPSWIEIADTGRGGTPGAGNGLTGLRERLDAVGGTLTATGGYSGFTLRAEVTRTHPAIEPAAGDQPLRQGQP